MKYYEGKNNTNFDCDKVPKEGSQCICVSVILIDSVFRIGKTYYPDVLLEKFKYIVKQKRMPKYITDELETFSPNENSDKKVIVKNKWSIMEMSFCGSNFC